eukprot:2364676-Amphidinium_carterae.1
MAPKRNKEKILSHTSASVRELLCVYGKVHQPLTAAGLREVRSLSSGVIDYLVTSATEFIEEHARDAILLQYSQDSTPVKVRRHISKGS